MATEDSGKGSHPAGAEGCLEEAAGRGGVACGGPATGRSSQTGCRGGPDGQGALKASGFKQGSRVTRLAFWEVTGRHTN